MARDRSRFRVRWSLRFLVGVAALIPLASAASDGVVEINQASALAGGGFPVTISTTGSYRLTSNLTVSNSADAIAVTGIDVYLDLNGFSILGPAGCAGAAPPAGSGSGVVSSARGTTVSNGTVRGFADRGVSLVAEGRVADVRVRCAGVAGIRVGSEGRVERSAVSQSAVGIETGPTALLIDNEITSNAGFAVTLGSGSAIRSNVLVGNNGGNANPQIQASGSFFELGLNRCGSGLTCAAGGVCGNGAVEAGEGCDDANTTAGDGCSAVCQVENGFQCNGQPSVCTAAGVCGDGVVGLGETCDDGNTFSGDGCSATCQVQSGFSCTGQPSVCSTICGDGIVAGAEQCDGFDLNGQTCQTLGFSSGSLSCAGCVLNFGGCIP